MAAQLAPIYLDNNRITLQGDPKPNVEKIVRTAGKRPERVRVVRLNAQTDVDGATLNFSDVIDREANAATPIYLRAIEGKTPGGGTFAAESKPGLKTGTMPETKATETFRPVEGTAPVVKPANPSNANPPTKGQKPAKMEAGAESAEIKSDWEKDD